MLYCGEKIGDGKKPAVDIAVDPLDGTTLTAEGRPGAISVIALAERGSLFDPGCDDSPVACFHLPSLRRRILYNSAPRMIPVVHRGLKLYIEVDAKSCRGMYLLSILYMYERSWSSATLADIASPRLSGPACT